MRRTLTTISITAFWLVMTGMLIHREVRPAYQAVRRAGYKPLLADLQTPSVDQMGIYRGRERIGRARAERRRRPDGGYEIEGVFEIQSPILIYARPTPLSVEVLLSLNRAMALERVDVLLDAVIFARLVGTVEDDAIVFETVEGKSIGPLRIPFNRREMFGHMMMPMMSGRKLSVGDRWEMKVLPMMPLVGAQRATMVVKAFEEVEIDGKKHKAYRVEQRLGELDNMTYSAWVSADGVVLRQEMPYGLTLVREEPSDD